MGFAEKCLAKALPAEYAHATKDRPFLSQKEIEEKWAKIKANRARYKKALALGNAATYKDRSYMEPSEVIVSKGGPTSRPA